MHVEEVVEQIVDASNPPVTNADLLKKIILITYLGRLQVNGQSPDSRITLSEYLFDNEGIIFDYTRLSETQKNRFLNWFLKPHDHDKVLVDNNGVSINEYRSFTAEVELNWWGRIKRFFGIRDTEYWKLQDRNLIFGYQLNGIKMRHGKHGSLLAFEQHFVPDGGTRYSERNYASSRIERNTKRLIITDRLVDQLLKYDLNHTNFSNIIRSAHPLSTDVQDYPSRYVDMKSYRITQRFEGERPWYMRLWDWVKSFFISVPKDSAASQKTEEMTVLHRDNTVHILQRTDTHGLVVTEKKPDIENIVFCGGGPKIFGHVGVCKALNDANIRPKRFAGSSAGAIISLLYYLGYTGLEIERIFSKWRQEHVLYFEFDTNGASDPKALKTALDFAVAVKIKQVTERNGLNYPDGPITFAVLEEIRKACLKKNVDCGFGLELVVTATNKRRRTTKYFSYALTPDHEVTDAVKVSSSVPLFFRPSLVDGEEHNDGGLINNFPTEAFADDHSTLLETEFGNNLKLLAVQFDTGSERSAIDNGMSEVYRENILLNFIYGLMGGVNDPASGWEQDRLKLRKYSGQSVVIRMFQTPNSFAVEQDARLRMMENGYSAVIDYLQPRYSKNSDGSYRENDELMYATFASLGDLLAYTCYRGNLQWFELVNNLIGNSRVPNKALLMKKSIMLRKLYFSDENALHSPESQSPTNSPLFFKQHFTKKNTLLVRQQNPLALLTIYPLFLKFTTDYLSDKYDKDRFNRAHHAVCIENPFACLTYLDLISNESHILLYLFVLLIRELQLDPSSNSIQGLQQVMDTGISYLSPDFYGRWSINKQQAIRVMRNLKNNKPFDAALLCQRLKDKPEEPLQRIGATNTYFDDFDDSLNFPGFYKLLIRLCRSLVQDKNDKIAVESAIVKPGVNSELSFLGCMEKVKGPKHVLLLSLIFVLKMDREELSGALMESIMQTLNRLYANEKDFDSPVFYQQGKALSKTQVTTLFELFAAGQINQAEEFSAQLQTAPTNPAPPISLTLTS